VIDPWFVLLFAKMAIAAKNIARIECASIRAPHPAQRFC